MKDFFLHPDWVHFVVINGILVGATIFFEISEWSSVFKSTTVGGVFKKFLKYSPILFALQLAVLAYNGFELYHMFQLNNEKNWHKSGWALFISYGLLALSSIRVPKIFKAMEDI